jgi:hypothetical protein
MGVPCQNLATAIARTTAYKQQRYLHVSVVKFGLLRQSIWDGCCSTYENEVILKTKQEVKKGLRRYWEC